MKIERDIVSRKTLLIRPFSAHGITQLCDCLIYYNIISSLYYI